MAQHDDNQSMSQAPGLSSAEVRQRFLEYFAERGHTVVESALESTVSWVVM